MKKERIFRRRNMGLTKVLVLGLFAMWGTMLLLLPVADFLSQKILNERGTEKNEQYLIDRLENMDDADYYLEDQDDLWKNGCYFEVVAPSGKILHSSAPDQSPATGQIPCDVMRLLPERSDMTEFCISPYEREDGAKYILLSQFRNKSDFQQLGSLVIIDNNHKIVFDEEGELGREISDSAYQMLEDNEKDLLAKQAFINRSGNKRYLFVHHNWERHVKVMRNRERMIYLVQIGFVLTTMMSVLTIGFIIGRFIAKPIRQLEKAINGFSPEKGVGELPTTGPREVHSLVRTYKEMSERLVRLEKERKTLKERQTAMLSDVTHDLKTPITVVRGYVNAMTDGLIAKEEETKYLTIISKEIQHIAVLIDTFGDYSRMNRADYRVSLRRGELTEFIRAFFAERYERIEMMGDRFEADIPEDPVFAKFDPVLLGRVFGNILSNAVKHNEEGTMIAVSLWTEGDKIRILMGDDGKGIPVELYDTIFEPFVLADDSRPSSSGSGLGLSIAKKIVELHNGSIRLLLPGEKMICEHITKNSRHSKLGTYFLIELPRLRQGDESADIVAVDFPGGGVLIKKKNGPTGAPLL
jgi:signal transduction histidine kinase